MAVGLPSGFKGHIDLYSDGYNSFISPNKVLCGAYRCLFLPPTTKLQQGNVFTPVCHSVHRGSGRPPQEQTPRLAADTLPGADTPLGADTLPGADPPQPPRAVHAGRYGQQVDGTHPTGMHTCLVKCSFTDAPPFDGCRKGISCGMSLYTFLIS